MTGVAMLPKTNQFLDVLGRGGGQADDSISGSVIEPEASVAFDKAGTKDDVSDRSMNFVTRLRPEDRIGMTV